MASVTVFRVETKDFGFGPYQSTNLTFSQAYILDPMADAHNGSRNHQRPQDDALLNGIEYYEFCGFSSLEQLKAWFYGWDDHLTQAGFIVQVYSALPHHVRYGKDQCLFQIDKAIPGEQMTISQVFTEA